jgi:hypothetical protein
MSDSIRLKTSRPAVGGSGSAREPGAQLAGWIAVVGIGGALLIMAAAALIRQEWMAPPMAMPRAGLPFELHFVQIPKKVVIGALWLSGLMAAGGVAAGLVAARRGARPSMRLILIPAAVIVALLAVLPPAGSTDSLDYASYGQLLLLGRDPYVVAPHLLRVIDPGFARSVPRHWQFQVSLYGPLATFEQYVAARLGGNSPAVIVFWLKLWNAVGFGAVALIADRLLRSDPARRLRAHLLWTVNPLLVWGLIEAGHLDVIAAAAGLLGLLVVGAHSPSVRPPRGVPGGRPPGPALLRALAAGALIGVAADIKINYLLFAVGLAWALRRWPTALAAALGGGLAVLAPSYAWFGGPAVRALFARRNKTAVDSFYRLIHLGPVRPYLGELAIVLFIALVILLLRRMPPADPFRPALRPALALSIAWLIVWPYQLPWYDAMAFCLLLFYPASRLDWLMIVRLTVATLANTPGNPTLPPGRTLVVIDQLIVHRLAPVVLLGCGVWLVVMACTGRWGPQLPGETVSLPDSSPVAPAA